MTQLDQLWYTWSDIGLQGHSRFQIRAASSGLADPSSTLTAAALRLCYYDFPGVASSGVTPVGYGWIDLGQRRFVFRRCAAGTDDFGRAGRFFVHLIVGAARELPAALLAARFSSPFWRQDDTGLDRSTRLPKVTVADITVGLTVPIDRIVGADFCRALIAARANGRTLAVRAPAEAVAGLVLRAHEVLPSAAFEGLSISTYEAAAASRHYDIVGVADWDDAPPDVITLDPSIRFEGDVLATDFVDAALRSEEGDEVAASIEAASCGGRFSFSTLVNIYRTISKIDRSERISDDALVGALRTPLARSKVIDSSAPLERFAVLLSDGDPGAWNVLRSAWQHVTSRDARLLGSAVGRAVWASMSRGVEAPLQQILLLLRSFSQWAASACVDGLLAQARPDPAPLFRLTVRDRIELFRNLDGGLDPHHREVLLTIDEPDLGLILREHDLPVSLRALAASQTIERQGLTRAIKALLLRDQLVLPQLVVLLDEDGLLVTVGASLLADIDRSTAETLSRDLYRLTDAGAPVVFDCISPHLSIVARLNSAMSWADRTANPMAYERLTDSIADYCLATLDGTEHRPQLAAGLLQVLGGTRHADSLAWLAIWNASVTLQPPLPGHSFAESLASLDAETRAVPHRQRAGALELVADRALRAARTLAEADQVFNWLAAAGGVDTTAQANAGRFLRNAIRERKNRSSAAAPLLAIDYVGRSIEDKELPTSRDGRLRTSKALLPGDVQRLAESLIALLNTGEIEHLQAKVKATYPRARRWWAAALLEARDASPTTSATLLDRRSSSRNPRGARAL